MNFLHGLPTAWVSISLNDLCIDIKQRAPLPDEQFTYIDIASIDRDLKQITEPQMLIGQDAPSRARKVIMANDVLVSMTRPNLNAVALVQNKLLNPIASTGFDVLRANLIEPKWLYFHVRSQKFIDTLLDKVQGALYPAVKSSDIRSYEIPLPPLAEQQEIATRLDDLLAQVDAIKARLDAIPAILKRFRQAVLAAAVSGKLTEDWRETNYSEWQWIKLADVAEIKSGITKDSKKQDDSYIELPYLRVANVQRYFLDLSEVKTIRIPENRVDDLLLEVGDILFNEGGDLDKLGRGWIWEGQLEKCVFQNHVFRARLFDKDNSSKYISYWANSEGFDYFIRNGKQTTNLASINKKILSELPISLPLPKEQTEIVNRVEQLFAFADQIEQQVQAAQTRVNQLTQAILAKAFKGELTAAWRAAHPELISGENSAEALLEKIKVSQIPAKPKRGKTTNNTLSLLPD